MSRLLSRQICMMIAVLLVTVGGFAGSARADSELEPTNDWSRDYGSWSSGEGVVPTSDGGYLSIGSITEKGEVGEWESYFQKAYILKLNAQGEVEWEQKLTHDHSTTNAAYHGIETKDGGYFVIGASTNQSGQPYSQLYMIKLDSAGKVQWEKTQDAALLHSTPQSVIETPEGDFLIGGKSISGMGYSTAYVLKTDGNGQELWYKKYRFGDSQFFNDLIPALDGGYIAVGGINSPEYEPGDKDALLIVKLDEDGNMVWSKQISDPNTDRAAIAIIPAEEGGYMIGSQKVIDQQRITILTKTDLNGQEQWEKTYNNTGSDYEVFNYLVQTKDGFAFLGGHYSGDSSNRKIQYDILMVNPNGELLNRVLFKGAPLYSYGKGVEAPDGGFIVPGTVKRGETTKFQLMKVAPLVDLPSSERTLTSITFTEKVKKLKTGTSLPAVLQAVYSDGSASDLSNNAVYSSEDEAVAAVDTLGRITGVSTGETYIHAVFEGLNTGLKVIVLPEDSDELDPVNGYLKLDSSDYSLSAGSMIDMKVTLFDYYTGKETEVTKLTTFRSDHPDIADFDDEGNLVGYRAGITKIYAIYKGNYASASVQVVRAAVPEVEEHKDPGVEAADTNADTGEGSVVTERNG